MSAAPAEGHVWLVVDDDVPFCTALAGALRRRGARAVVAYNASDALREARAWRPQRATIDLRIGADSGIDLLRDLRELLPDIELLVLTGFGSIATAVDAVKAGAIHYLTKPASVEEILRAFSAPDEAAGSLQAGDDAAVASLDEVEREHLLRVLHEANDNVSEAARRLGLHRRTLQRKLARHR